jgi:hypothetical protein
MSSLERVPPTLEQFSKAVAKHFRESFGPLGDEGNGTLRLIVDLLATQQQHLNRLESVMEEVRQKLEGRLPELEKEWYTTKEAGQLTPFKEYTIRQACNKQRLPNDLFKKNHRTGKWWISREGINWLRENDLLSSQ